MSSGDSLPIFVVGTGRSGSTVFFDIFARHPNVAWLSELSRRFPSKPWLNQALMFCRQYAFVDRLLDRRYRPSEAYPFWDQNCPGFSNPYRDLTADDVTDAAATRIRASVDRVTNHKRHRFLAKITGWPRIRYLQRIFPQALFIEVSRNPFATACSLLEVGFWDGWRGPSIWRRGPLPPDLDVIWRDEDQSFVALAALEWVIIHRAMTQCRSVLRPDQFYAVHYGDLCKDPIEVFRKVVEFARLEWSSRFENAIRRTSLIDRDDQWRRTLTQNQQRVLERTFERAQALTQRET